MRIIRTWVHPFARALFVNYLRTRVRYFQCVRIYILFIHLFFHIFYLSVLLSFVLAYNIISFAACQYSSIATRWTPVDDRISLVFAIISVRMSMRAFSTFPACDFVHTPESLTKTNQRYTLISSRRLAFVVFLQSWAQSATPAITKSPQLCVFP